MEWEEFNALIKVMGSECLEAEWSCKMWFKNPKADQDGQPSAIVLHSAGHTHKEVYKRLLDSLIYKNRMGL